MLRNRYRVVERLGAGGGGTVYVVEDARAGGARVALKALWPRADDRGLVEALRSEFRVLAALRHPRLGRVFDFGRLPATSELDGADGRAGYFLTRELIEGRDLGAAARDAPVAQVCQWLAGAARLLHVLHGAGMRHGDFKPANAIVDDAGAVHLIDFGLTAEENARVSAGTLPYVAPEVLLRHAADRRADLYALGIALFELCAGELPSGSARGPALIDWHINAPRPALAGVGADVAAVCARLIAIDPAQRYPTAAEAAAALDACTGAATDADVAADVIVIPTPVRQVRDLEAALATRLAGNGGPAMVEVVGEVGAGKTSLLTEITWRAELAGADVVRADVAAPVGAMASAIEQVAALVDREPPTADDELARAAALTRWLAEASRAAPIVILIDDADFADAASARLADYIGRALPASARVALVAARRPAAGDDRDDGPAPTGDVPRVRIPELTAAAIGDLIHDAAGRRDDELADRLHALTGGNPLHVVEALRALARDGFPPAPRLDDIAMPAAIEQVIARVLDGASKPEAALLDVLAVLDRTGAPPLLRALGVDSGVGPALERGTVERNADGSIRWSRPGAARARYESLAPARRKALHAAVAEQLSEAGAPDDAIAIHDVRAGRRAGADRACAVADAMFARRDYPAARALYEALLELLAADDPRVRDVRLSLGDLFRRIGDPDRAAAALSPLVDGGDDRARLILARARTAAGDRDGADELFRAILDGAAASPDGIAAAIELAQSAAKRGRSAEAIGVADAALALDPDERAARQLRATRAYARGILGEDTAALAELQAIAAEASSSGERAVEAIVANYDAVLSFRRGDYTRARARYHAALAAAEAAGEVLRAGTLRMNLGSLAFHSGEYARCREHLVAAVSLLRAARAETSCTFARRNLGHLLLELGEYEQARAELRAVVDAAARLHLDSPHAAAHALLGIAAARTGDIDTARADLAVARRLFEDLGDTRELADTLLDLAEVELEAGAAGDVGAAAAAIAEAERAGGSQDSNRNARRLALAVTLAAARRDAEAARALLPDLGASLEAVRAEGGRHLEWTLHLAAAAGESALGRRDAAAAHRSAAVGLLEAMAVDLPADQRAAFWHDPRRRSLRDAPAQIIPSTIDLRDTLDNGGETSRTSERLFRLLEIYRRMSGERDLDRLLELVMDTAVELSGAERGFLLLASDGGELDLAIARNVPDADVEAMRTGPLSESRPYSRSIAERVFRTGQPVLSRSAREDPRFDRATSVHAMELESVLCIPVHLRGRVAGVLYMESRLQRARFGGDDLRLMQAFGDQVAIALANARLLEENTRRADELARARDEIAELLDQRTAELASAHRDLAKTRSLFRGTGAFGIVGRSPAMENVYHLIERLAATDIPVLVLGESGTGKELVARALHEHGPRRERPHVSVNCGALPEQLLASELFGHVRGAFTGADKSHKGLFQTADGGTLFLDEVGDTPERMQATLLRALQEHTIRPVGGARDIKVDVRVVAATNRPLDELVAAGRFRQDLYYRLHVVAIELPPLRDRREDVPLLCDHFLGLIAERAGAEKKPVTRRALRQLVDYDWPGNVRQLEHALTNAAVMAEGTTLDVDDFATLLTPAQRAARAPKPTAAADRAGRERERIVEALEACGWNKSRAARELGMPRRTFYRRLADYDIH